jgi:hypothetical protein
MQARRHSRTWEPISLTTPTVEQFANLRNSNSRPLVFLNPCRGVAARTREPAIDANRAKVNHRTVGQRGAIQIWCLARPVGKAD